MHSIRDWFSSKPCYNLDLLRHEIHHPTGNSWDVMHMKIHAWFKTTGLTSILTKQIWCFFHSEICSWDQYIFTVGNRIIEVTETIFFDVISVTINFKWNWSSHITYISKHVIKDAVIILNARKHFDQATLLPLHINLYPYHTWITVYVFGLTLLTFMSMISLSIKISLFV